MTRRRSTVLATLLALLAALLISTAAAPAQATFPGNNGLIAFNRGGNIYTATATGGSIRQITTSGGLSGAKWSPDGKKLAYKNTGGTVFVRTMSTGATVTLGAGANAAPVWSPDGKRVAWSSYNQDYEDNVTYPVIVKVVAATGGSTSTLTKFFDDFYPYQDNFQVSGWSLDGRRLLVTRSGGCCGGASWWSSISEFDLATSSFARSMAAVQCSDQDPCNAWLSSPAYGPGGNGVVFSGTSGTLPGSSNAATETEKVYAVDRSGTGLHRVSTASAVYNPTWSPNGANVLFTQTAGTTRNIMRVVGTSATAKATVLIANGSQADWQPVI